MGAGWALSACPALNGTVAGRGAPVIRVLLAEQLRLVRGALAALLDREQDIKVVGEVGEESQILPMALSLQPDVVVIDVDSLGDQGFGAVYNLREQLPQSRSLLITGSRTPERLRRAAMVHPWGFVTKDASPGTLAEAIRRVAEGSRYVDPEVALSVLDAPESPLTQRELEVLRLASDGTPPAEIATKLFLSVGTVRNYLSAAIAKTGARNRIEAIRIAQDAGWL